MADSTKRYVAVDLGIAGGKVVLASVSGGKVNTETVHEFRIPPLRIAGLDYWDIYAAYAEVLRGLSLVGLRKVSVESIGIDSWGPGIVCMTKDGNILGVPRLTADVLSESVQAKFFKRMERRALYDTTGVNVLDSHSALQLFALRRAKSVALEDAKHLSFIPSAIAYLLTGKRFCDLSTMSAAGLLDRNSKKISKEVMSACKVKPKRFPSIVQAGSKPGKLSEEVAEATGLGRIPVVAVAGDDLASAAAAVPYAPAASHSVSSSSAPSIASAAEGSAFLLVGAVSVIGVETASPIVNDQTFEMNFSNEAGLAGVNLLVKRIAGTDLLVRCLESWRDAGRAYGPEYVARMAREGAPTEAQLDPEDPALRGVPAAPAAITRFCSLRSMATPVDDAAMVRLVLSSLAEKVGDTFVKLQSVTPFRIKTLHIVGDFSSVLGPVDATGPDADGALESVFCQMVTDECAVPVTAGPADAAVLGNVLVQAGLTRQALSASQPPVTYTPAL